MFITKKHLSRRIVLRGLGVSISLPLLDAMIPAGTALADTAAAPRPKYGFFYLPHGAVMDHWKPAATGRDFELPQILAPFAPYKDHMTVVTGLRNEAAEGGAVHSLNPQTWLGCQSPMWDETGPDFGVSADQLAARHLGQDSPMPSLELCTESKGTISYRSFRQPLPMENNPRKLFYQLFGEGDTDAERKEIVEQTDSLLDLVSDSTASVRARLDAADRARVDDYLESVREIERRVQIAADQDLSALDLPDAPAGIPASFDEHIKLMFDLAALAYQAGVTRVVSMMMASEISMLTYNQVGVSEAFHPLSHHQNNPDKLTRLAVVQTYHSQAFTRFLERMASSPDGDGSLLDHSIILYGSNMSDSNLHNADPLPSLVFGRGYGRIKGGQHLHYPQDTPHANLMLTLLERGGVPVESLGNSTGVLSEV